MQRSALILFVLPLILMACNQPDEKAATDTPAKALRLGAEDIVTVQASALALGPVITGSIQAARRADLRAEVSAVVLQVLKENGDPVKRGELLVRLDDTAIRDNLTSADEAVRAAQQTLTQAERQLQRLQTLRGSGMASIQQLDDTETRRNNAASDLAAAKTRQAQARQQLLRTEVRAPFDGIASERRASAGDTAQVGKELVKVIDPASLRFDGFVSADEAVTVKVGQEVRFRVNGQGSAEFSGRISRINPAANPATRQLEVQVGFTGTIRPTVAGLYAEGRISSGGNAITIPLTSLQRDGEKAFVWKVDGAQLHKTAIALGLRDMRRGDQVVTGGLTSGDRILRHPPLTLKESQPVELTAPTAGN